MPRIFTEHLQCYLEEPSSIAGTTAVHHPHAASFLDCEVDGCSLGKASVQASSKSGLRPHQLQVSAWASAFSESAHHSHKHSNTEGQSAESAEEEALPFVLHRKPADQLMKSRVLLYGAFLGSWGGSMMMRMPEEVQEEEAEAAGPLHRRVSQQTRQHTNMRVIDGRVTNYNACVMMNPMQNANSMMPNRFDPEIWELQCHVYVVFWAAAILMFESTHLLRPFLLDGVFTFLAAEGPSQTVAEFYRVIAASSAFFLGFYTTNALSRWEDIWRSGILPIYQSCGKIVAGLSVDLPEEWVNEQAKVVRRSEVLDSVKRWSAASLGLMFQQFGAMKSVADSLARMQLDGILTADECQALADSPNPPLGIWAWQSNLLCNLEKSNLVSQSYFNISRAGHDGALHLLERLRTQFPVRYPQLVIYLVNSGNFLSANCQGVLLGRALLHDDVIEAFMHFLLITVSPLLNLALMHMNLKLSNPLQKHVAALSMESLVMGIDESCESLISASEHLPPLLSSGLVPSKTGSAAGSSAESSKA